MAHVDSSKSSPTPPNTAAGLPTHQADATVGVRANLQAMATALQACDGQLARVVEVMDRLADDVAALGITPLSRRPWELLARASRQLQASALAASRHRLSALRGLTERFAAAIDLLRDAQAHLQPLTFEVAQSSVNAHLEVCRQNLLEVGRIVGSLQGA